MNINERIEALREVMRREHLSAFIFPSTDPHHVSLSLASTVRQVRLW